MKYVEEQLDIIHGAMTQFMNRDDVMSVIDIRKIIRHMIVQTLTSMSRHKQLTYEDVKQYCDAVIKGLNSRFDISLDLREIRIMAMSAVISSEYSSNTDIVDIYNDDGTVFRSLNSQERASLPFIVSDITAKVLDRTSGTHIPESRIKSLINFYVNENVKSKTINFGAFKLVSRSNYVDQCIPIVYKVMQQYIT